MRAMKMLADALRTPQGWQPIDTAPRDGTPVLLWEDGLIGVFYWGDPGVDYYEKAMEPTWIGAVVLGNGLVERNIREPIVHLQGSSASHWMPLPEGPEQNATGT